MPAITQIASSHFAHHIPFLRQAASRASRQPACRQQGEFVRAITPLAATSLRLHLHPHVPVSTLLFVSQPLAMQPDVAWWCICSGGKGPPLPPAARQVLQPKVKLRPFFWSKLPPNKDNIWSRVQPPSAELELGQMAALEHLFAQAASTITPGRKKGADGKHALHVPSRKRE